MVTNSSPWVTNFLIFAIFALCLSILVLPEIQITSEFTEFCGENLTMEICQDKEDMNLIDFYFNSGLDRNLVLYMFLIFVIIINLICLEIYLLNQKYYFRSDPSSLRIIGWNALLALFLFLSYTLVVMANRGILIGINKFELTSNVYLLSLVPFLSILLQLRLKSIEIQDPIIISWPS